MNDIISINRQFLIMAREAAKLESGELLTGLSRPLLDRLGGMTLDQIEGLAKVVGVSVISLRLNEAELNRLSALPDPQKAAYAVAVVASVGR